MTIIDNLEYISEIKEVCDASIKEYKIIKWLDLISTVIMFLITIVIGAYLELPDAYLISIVIAVASYCVISTLLNVLLEMNVIIRAQTATIEWIGKKQFSTPETHDTYHD